MANPRKFSEKIALHNQKQAEETAAFERIMREVSDATSKVCSLPKNLIIYVKNIFTSYLFLLIYFDKHIYFNTFKLCASTIRIQLSDDTTSFIRDHEIMNMFNKFGTITELSMDFPQNYH